MSANSGVSQGVWSSFESSGRAGRGVAVNDTGLIGCGGPYADLPAQFGECAADNA